MMKIIEEYKSLIPEDVGGVLDVLKSTISKKSKSYNEIIQFKAQYNEIEKDKRQGTKHEDEIILRLNKLRNSILSFLDTLEKDDLLESIIPIKKVANNEETSNRKSTNDEDLFLMDLKLFGLKQKLKSNEGLKIYEDSFIAFSNCLVKLIEEYSEIAYVKPQIKTSSEKFGIIILDFVTLKVVPCPAKRIIWISIDSNLSQQEQSGSVTKQKSTLDVFTLFYTNDCNLVWQSRNDISVNLSGAELAKMVARKAFNIIMTRKT